VEGTVIGVQGFDFMKPTPVDCLPVNPLHNTECTRIAREQPAVIPLQRNRDTRAMNERSMASARGSLRLVVEHWLAPDLANQIRVIRFRNQRSTGECYVCVETVKPRGTVAMFFFRHRDGAWRVFPPSQKRPMMCVA
jgi:hypothetical protein